MKRNRQTVPRIPRAFQVAALGVLSETDPSSEGKRRLERMQASLAREGSHCADAQANILETMALPLPGEEGIIPLRRCRDCGMPTYNYRCDDCLLGFARKHGVDPGEFGLDAHRWQ